MLGTKLADRYEIVSELGRGGMGVVYRARDPRLNRDVAVKLIPPSQLSAEAEQRFQREAQLVAQMDHPSIVPIYDFGRHDEALYFVMALVQGTNLRAFLRQDSQLGDVVDIGIQVAEALDYSHTRGVVHRDIKPENIMVAREAGLGVRVRVMDFGLARATSESRMTRTGTLMGTLGYLSPEQITGRTLDGRSDIYALGTVLYEAVVGEPPFTGEPQAVVYRIVHEFAQAPRSRGAAIDESLEGIILGCLLKEPERRPQQAGELAAALKRYKAGLRDSDRGRFVAELTRTVHVQKPALAPFIGRQKESAALQRRLNLAVGGESQVVLVGGDAGIGKTRLLDELENLARARQIRVLHGRFLEQDRGLPYQGFLEIILEYFGLKDGASTPPPDMSDLAPDLVATFPILGEIPEIRAAVGSGPALEARPKVPENRTQVFELLARTVTRLAAGRPLVLLFEDLHAAEVSIDALEYLVRRLGPAPVLVVGTYRSTEITPRHPLSRAIEGLEGERRAESFVLGPLTASEHRAFVETLVGAGITDGLVRKLFAGSEGNPFFTKELVRSLVDSGGIARDGSGAWNLSAEAGLAAEAMPATIQKAVEKRIGRLPDDLREILAVASVFGTAFDARDLAALMQARDVDDALDQLVEQGLIEEARESRGDALRFSSGVVHDVLYAGLSPRKRRSLHRRAVELLEARHAGRLDRVLPQLVHHSVQGDVPEKAVEYALRLARTSLDAFSVEDAIRSTSTALTFLDAEWEGQRVIEGDARLLLARAQLLAGDVEIALRESASAVRIFEQEGDNARLVPALVFTAETAWQARQTDQMGRSVVQALPIARAAGDTGSLLRLLSLAATRANLVGEYEQANAHLEESARIGAVRQDVERDEDVPAGGRLVVAMATPIASVEPVAIAINEEAEISATIFETLLATDPNGHLVPWLCERWELGDGATRLALVLRQGVQFSDGTPLSSTAVKQALEGSIRSAATLPAAFAVIRGVPEFRAGDAAGVEGIAAHGDRELHIRLTEALPIYPALLTEGRTAVARPLGDTVNGPPPVGTGPFSITTLRQDRIVVERHATYWRSGSPRVDAIEFRAGLAATAIARSFRAGELDLARDLQPQDLEDLLRDARLRRGLAQVPKKNTYFVLFNCLSGPVARSLDVRKALSGVVRPRDLVWRALGRFAAPAAGLIPPGMLGHDPGRRWPSLSRMEASDLLRGSGLPQPMRLRAAVQPLLRDRAQSLLSALFEAWADLGVDVRADSLDMATYLDAWQHNADVDLLIGRWNADYDDPDNVTHTLFRSGTGELHRYFSSPEADRVLDDARAESRPAVRESLYRAFEAQLLDHGALVPLFHDIDYRLASSKVRGLALRGTKPYVNYADLGVTAAESAAFESRRAGGIVHIPLTGVITTMDPAQPSTAESSEVLQGPFETLTRQTGMAQIVPWLASDVRTEDGGRRYRIRLRNDVTFHDGRRLTARDVRYSFERLLQVGGTADRELYSSVRGASALSSGDARELTGFHIHSATEFTIDLEEPVAFFPALLSHSAIGVIPEGSEPPAGAAPTSWVGTGPFRITAFEPGRRVAFERNPSYWRRGLPQSDALVIHLGVNPKDILAGFKDGRFSLAWDLLPSDLEELRREPDFAAGFREVPKMVTYYVAFNTRRGPMAERAMRRALVRAIDVPRLVRQTLGRVAIPAHGLIPPGLLRRDAVSSTRLDSVGPAAFETMAAGLELTAAVHPAFLSTYAPFTKELFTAFASLGITVRPVTSSMVEFVDALNRGDVDLGIGRWYADYPDPDTFAYTLHSEQGFLGRVCSSPATDRLMARARTETTAAVRHGLYLQFEDVVADEALLLPLFHEQAYRLARPDVEGLSVSLGFPVVPFEELRVRT
jgi:ABC-type transport system substrate-binding protein